MDLSVPVSVASAELWKIGQLRAGDKIRFIRISHENALCMLKSQEDALVKGIPYDETPFSCQASWINCYTRK